MTKRTISREFLWTIPDVVYAPSECIFRNKAFNRFHSIISTFDTPPTLILLLISQLDQYSDSFYTNSPPSIVAVRHTVKSLGSKLVLSSPDRNRGIADI